MIEKSGVHLCLFISCQCLEVGGGCSVGTTTSSSGGCNQGWIADGYCDDINNNVDCTYDGGDCCGSNVNTVYCTECQCLEVGGGTSVGTTTSSSVATTSGGWEGMILSLYFQIHNQNMHAIGDLCK